MTDDRAGAMRDAIEFWNGYHIPFRCDVATKGRLAGLSRGSTGTGATRRTVVHLFVLDGFVDGRLARDADRYLCTDEAKLRFDGTRHVGPNGTEYVPKVTCKRCLSLMDRWETDQSAHHCRLYREQRAESERLAADGPEI